MDGDFCACFERRSYARNRWCCESPPLPRTRLYKPWQEPESAPKGSSWEVCGARGLRCAQTITVVVCVGASTRTLYSRLLSSHALQPFGGRAPMRVGGLAVGFRCAVERCGNLNTRPGLRTPSTRVNTPISDAHAMVREWQQGARSRRSQAREAARSAPMLLFLQSFNIMTPA